MPAGTGVCAVSVWDVAAGSGETGAAALPGIADRHRLLAGPLLARGVLSRQKARYPPCPWRMGRYAEPVRDIVAMPAAAMETTVARSHIVPLQWPGLVLLGWAVGVLLLLALVLWQIVSVRRSLSRSRPAGPRMVGLLEECCAELGVTTPVTLRLTDEVRSPAVSGFWRPVILLPAGAASGTVAGGPAHHSHARAGPYQAARPLGESGADRPASGLFLAPARVGHEQRSCGTCGSWPSMRRSSSPCGRRPSATPTR